MLMKLFPNIALVIIFLAFFVQPLTAYPEDFFELSGSGFKPLKYKEPFTGKISLAADNIPECGRVLWFDTNASIPANWGRDTNFNGLVAMQGVSEFTDAKVFLGDHNHSSDHTNSSNTHTHPFTGSSVSGTSIGGEFDFGGVKMSAVTHSHNSANTSTGDTLEYTVKGGDAGTDLNSAIPPHVTVIFLKPDNGSQDIPTGAAVFTDEASVPTDFSIVSDDLNSLFILGTEAGQDGNTTGGDLNHLHTSPDHNMTNIHKHENFVSGLSNTLVRGAPSVDRTVLVRAHHNIGRTSSETVDSDAESITFNEAEFEPFSTRLLTIQNDGSASTPNDIIIAFLCPASEIPSGWILMDGTGESNYDLTDTQIKITTSTGDIGVTDGNNNGFHGSDEHLHTNLAIHGSSHTPFADFSFITSVVLSDSTNFLTLVPHPHTWTLTSQGYTLLASSVDSGVTDSRYKYKQVLFIKKTDPCIYDGSGDFVVNCADSCQITSDVDLAGNALIITGSGDFGLQAVLRRVLYREFDPAICTFSLYVNNGGAIEYGS